LLKISDICTINIDTFAEEALCYSNRRSVLKKENDYGRMISTIVIKDYKQ
jgi:copper oxidase (laccase) domain-containing protein